MQAFLEYISRCPTAFHTVAYLQQQLEDHGFVPYVPAQTPVRPGMNLYFVQNRSTLFAFRIPQTAPKTLLLASAHADSPCLCLKAEPLLRDTCGARFNVERYGSMRLSSWLDVPLGIAGRVVYRKGNGLATALVDSRRPLCLIPSVATHLQKEQLPEPGVDLYPVFSDSSQAQVIPLLCQEAGIDPDTVCGYDLYLYNAMAPTLWGDAAQFISAPRLDDQTCVYAMAQGFLEAKVAEGVMPILAVFDNEEVGSGTKQGADSALLSRVLDSLWEGLGLTQTQRLALDSAAFALSADNAHGVHPNHPELCDKMDRPYLNRGIVLKHNANQRYTTDAVSRALVRFVGEKAGVTLQEYSNRPDLPGGSTLGNLLVRQLPWDCADIGLAQWSMHSSYETVGARDLADMCRFFTQFYSAPLAKVGGQWQWKEEKL